MIKLMMESGNGQFSWIKWRLVICIFAFSNVTMHTMRILGLFYQFYFVQEIRDGCLSWDSADMMLTRTPFQKHCWREIGNNRLI